MRDEEDPVQSHLQTDKKPPTQITKPKEVSKSPIKEKDDVSNNSRKTYGNLNTSQDGPS